MRRYPFKYVMNLRDLGGYPLDLRRYTKYGAFLRSGLPARVTEEEFSLLLEMGVNTVIDLRTAEELRETASAFYVNDSFAYHHIPFPIGASFPGTAEGVSQIYFAMADEKRTILTVMREISRADGGVLFHCAAGKDRTGIVAALLLSAAGVSRQDIVADYQVTFTYNDLLREGARNCRTNAQAFGFRSEPECMEGFLSLLDEKYGSAVSYLEAAGLSAGEIEALISKLV